MSRLSVTTESLEALRVEDVEELGKVDRDRGQRVAALRDDGEPRGVAS